jgi:ClpP class serine protease
MSILLPHIAARIFNTPLMIDVRKAMAMLAAIGGRVSEGGILLEGGDEPIDHVAFESGRPSLGRIGDRLGRRLANDGRDMFDMIGNVAVIPIEGSLIHKGGWVGSYSGETSYQGLQAQISAAGRHPNVRGVAFEVDSFGGEASGVFETADMIAQLSLAKPTIAILTDHALSAGYLLAAASRQIVTPKHGNLGSIGAITLHMDMTGALEKKGVKVTVIRAERKAEANPVEPLSAKAADHLKASLEATRLSFADAVGRYRGARFTKERAMATEAHYYGGEEAVAMGLADATGHGNQVFEAFVNEVNRR